MAPQRRRQNRPPQPESPRPASPAPSNDQSRQEADEPSGFPPLSFYNTTFSAHRVSPLYLGSEPLTTSRLQVLAQRLRDKLVGDVVRGVELGLGPDGGEGSVMGRAGALENVEMRWVSVADVLDIPQEGEENTGVDDMDLGDGRTEWRRVAENLGRKRALHISLRYELASCTALMLPPLKDDGNDSPSAGQVRFSVGVSADDMNWEQSVDPAHFLSLPLLLLRMPAPLKAAIGDFLSTTFDCRVSAMRLGTRSLVRSWEAWIRSAGLPSRGPLAKDAVLSLGFYVPPPDKANTQGQNSGQEPAADQQLGLRSIDVIIPAAELGKFVAVGKRLAKTETKRPGSTGWAWEVDPKKRRTLAGRLYEEGWEWRTASDRDNGDAPAQQPFTEALACYLKEQLSLNLFHPGVRVIKIACGGFVVSETRLKVFAPPGAGGTDVGAESVAGQRRAVCELLGNLIEKAQVQGMSG
ncbi:hypothetical protein VTK56DRAFT_8127 [Thermocarpiscus australiensis]